MTSIVDSIPDFDIEKFYKGDKMTDDSHEVQKLKNRERELTRHLAVVKTNTINSAGTYDKVAAQLNEYRTKLKLPHVPTKCRTIFDTVED